MGSIMDEKGGTNAGVLSRINKSRAAFASLKPLWRSNVISLKTKIRLFNSNVKTVLLYGSECWKISKEIAKKLTVFEHKCLRIILQIRWPMIVSKKCIRERCNREDIMLDQARRRWNWLGHVLRKPASSITKEALYWTPTRAHKRGRPRLTWQRCGDGQSKRVVLKAGKPESRKSGKPEFRKPRPGMLKPGMTLFFQMTKVVKIAIILGYV